MDQDNRQQAAREDWQAVTRNKVTSGASRSQANHVLAAGSDAAAALKSEIGQSLSANQKVSGRGDRRRMSSRGGNSKQEMEEGGHSTDELADACSSSLERMAVAAYQRAAMATTTTTTMNDEDDAAECGSSWSGKSGSAAAVTGTLSATTAASSTSSSGDDGRPEASGFDRNVADGASFYPGASSSRHEKAALQGSASFRAGSNQGCERIKIHRPHNGAHRNQRLQHQGKGFGMGAHEPREHATVATHLLPRSDRLEPVDASLLEPYRETSVHTIRKTFHRCAKRASTRSSDSCGDEEWPAFKRRRLMSRSASAKCGEPRLAMSPTAEPACAQKKRQTRGARDDEDGSAGSSGTEGGYAASMSSGGNGALMGSCSSPSSDDSCEINEQRKRRLHSPSSSCLRQKSTGGRHRPFLSKKVHMTNSLSSEIADFSSSTSADERCNVNAFEAGSESASISSSSNDDAFSNEDPAEERVAKNTPASKAPLRRRPAPRWHPLSCRVPTSNSVRSREDGIRNQLVHIDDQKPAARTTGYPILKGRTPIMALGCDVMAHVLTYLEPQEILATLTMPLSKDWLNTFTKQPELWRVLCLLEPFKAQVDDHGYDSTDSDDDYDSDCDLPFHDEENAKTTFGKYRILYTSFIRCMRYLVRIKDDAVNGRPLSVIDYAVDQSRGTGGSQNIQDNRNLQQFLSRARSVMAPASAFPVVQQVASHAPVNLSDDEGLALKSKAGGVLTPGNDYKKQSKSSEALNSKVKFGHSKLTQRLLGPTASGAVGEVDLPWSCGIYSIVNWMVAFADVEGIQTMCLKVLPFLLENEQQRITAQRAGLTDIVLRGMVLFPESAQLHIAAFHTIVLLARPLGGREGMLFHTSMVNSTGIFCSTEQGAAGGKSGIAVLLDSMRRFQSDEVLQAMSCWSLVNIALAPAQKEVLVKLGGIEVTAQAMLEHPYNAEVQFRALFALINLVIPAVGLPRPDSIVVAYPDNEESASSSDEELSDRVNFDIDQIVHLVILSMKTFCSNEAILNRACLVLHNLSLTPAYHEAMLWTPNCYQMLEWCLGNYRTDQVLQQSAAGTLHRLQITLSNNGTLRSRFAGFIHAQQQHSLEQAHREAMLLHEQQELEAAEQLVEGDQD
jgi:hypothetical protein